MRTKVQKWGNSLALRIPKAIVEDAHVHVGSTVQLRVQDGNLVVEPTEGPRYDLEDLLSGVRKSNLHSEVKTCAAVGRESW